MSVYDRTLGLPWVFENLRPWVVGGIDMSPAYHRLESDDRSVILDVGCGTGDALNYVRRFERYVGLDTDHRALDVARARHASDKVQFACRPVQHEDWTSGVTHVCMVGLLHHLADQEAGRLLECASTCVTLQRIVTLDIVYLDRQLFGNALAFLDRGRHCRRPEGYTRLADAAGLRVVEQLVVPCHPTTGRVKYFVMSLERRTR